MAKAIVYLMLTLAHVCHLPFGVVQVRILLFVSPWLIVFAYAAIVVLELRHCRHVPSCRRHCVSFAFGLARRLRLARLRSVRQRRRNRSNATNKGCTNAQTRKSDYYRW